MYISLTRARAEGSGAGDLDLVMDRQEDFYKARVQTQGKVFQNSRKFPKIFLSLLGNIADKGSYLTMKSKPLPKKKSTPSPINPEDDTQRPADPASLEKVVAKAQRIIDLEGEIATAELRLKELNQSLTSVACEELPGLMNSLDIKEFTLKNGAKVVIKSIVSASIPTEAGIEKIRDKDEQAEARDRFERALEYLEDNGAGSIIKSVVIADIGKGNEKLVKKAIAALAKLKIDAESMRAVHAQTLTSWVRERIEAGSDVDHEVLKVYTGEKATIVQPKGKKAKADKSLF